MHDDLPEEIRAALADANHDDRVERLNAALHTVAICQQELKLRSIISNWDTNGTVTISTYGDASGKKATPYAKIDRVARSIDIVGKPPAQSKAETDEID